MNKPPFWLACTITAANIFAVLDMPYGYYQFLRLIVTGYAGYVSYVYFTRGPRQWGWVFGTVALLYNPVFLVTMSKEFHTVVNLAVAGLMIFEFYKLRDIEQPPASVSEVKEEPKTAPPLRNATHSEKTSGGLFRVVFPPLLALAIGVGIIAAMTYVNSRPSDEASEVTNAESSPAEFPAEASAPLPLDELPTAATSSDDAGLNEAIPTVGAFTDKVDAAARQFTEVLKAEGMIGAETYSKNCQNAAQQSSDILQTDYCTAFDMAALLIDQGVTSESGLPQNEYFKSRASALDGDYARFTQASQNRTELIWQEVKSALAPAMYEPGI
ncbi:DUF6804 family protein [Novosphingobium sp. Leaf2]|uniref:DUF6804 family protein n=1 Tax=Novosphingobium sp. Leaf2 TaxID=1735670 RepID=UPI0012E20E16|nr:DUF6804 family protein [Novosphingobium sp. Leaf2]